MRRKKNWDFPTCCEIGNAYPCRSAFARGNGAAYNAAKRNGWLDKIIPESKSGKGAEFSHSYAAYFKKPMSSEIPSGASLYVVHSNKNSKCVPMYVSTKSFGEDADIIRSHYYRCFKSLIPDLKFSQVSICKVGYYEKKHPYEH